MWFMEMKVILRFKISGESLDIGKTASNNGSEKIGSAVSKYTILLILFFNSTYYNCNKSMQIQNCVMENMLWIWK